MQDIIKFMTIFSQSTPMAQHLKEHGIATQTDISAVHTPQVELINTVIKFYYIW